MEQRSCRWYCLVLRTLILCLTLDTAGGATVTANLGDTVHLPCTFPFIQDGTNLLLLWERMDGNGKRLVHKFLNGQDDLSQQAPQYTGRTALSSNLSQGNLALTLTNVTLRDRGTYYCRGTNRIRPESISVTLSIFDPVLIYNISSTSSRLGEDIAVTVQFSGEESHVTWELDEGRLPERYRLIDDNRTLIIPSVQRDDAERTFRVRVTNPVSEEVRDYRLEIWDQRLEIREPDEPKPEPQPGPSIIAISISAAGVALLVAVIIYIIYRKRPQKTAKRDGEKPVGLETVTVNDDDCRQTEDGCTATSGNDPVQKAENGPASVTANGYTPIALDDPEQTAEKGSTPVTPNSYTPIAQDDPVQTAEMGSTPVTTNSCTPVGHDDPVHTAEKGSTSVTPNSHIPIGQAGSLQTAEKGSTHVILNGYTPIPQDDSAPITQLQ